MNTEKTNTILDLPETNPANNKPEWRPYFLVIESAVFVLILIAGRLGGKYMLAGVTVLTFPLILFNFVVPIIKLVRKEIKVGLFIVYLVQALAFTIPILALLFHLQDWPYAAEFVIAGILILWLPFLLTPNVEIRKYNAKGIMHLLVTLLGKGMTVCYIGFLFSLENWPYGIDFLLIGGGMTALATGLDTYQLFPQ